MALLFGASGSICHDSAVAYLFCSMVSGVAALVAFAGGALLVPAADATGRRALGRPALVFWALAVVALGLCLVCGVLGLFRMVPGGGAND